MNSKQLGDMIIKVELPAMETVAVEDIVEDMLATYIDEMDTLLSKLEAAAMSLESARHVDELLAEIRRVLHSTKGDSGMCGVSAVQNICHDLESVLDELHKQGCLADVLLKSKDWIEAVVRYLSTADIADAKNRQMEQNEKKTKLKALVVDDDVVCRDRLKMLLEDFFDCTFAINGKEGLELYEKSLRDQNPYALMTLDINMPQMNGHETLEAIRKVEEQYGIQGLDVVKVIMTTSESSSKHVFAVFREGCEACVVKTAMGAKLLDTVVDLGLFESGQSPERLCHRLDSAL